jgi:hypothetical protein
MQRWMDAGISYAQKLGATVSVPEHHLGEPD